MGLNEPQTVKDLGLSDLDNYDSQTAEEWSAVYIVPAWLKMLRFQQPFSGVYKDFDSPLHGLRVVFCKLGQETGNMVD